MAKLSETLDLLVRNPRSLLDRIRSSRDVDELPLQLTVVAVTGFAAFGFLFGLTRSPLWGAIAAPKLVLVALGSVAVCLPALHVYGRLLGNAATLRQQVCEALVALASSGVTLVALCPVWLVFARQVNAPPTGYFLVMLGAVAFIGLAGLRGAWVLVSGLRAQRRPVLHLAAWTLIYGMVGMQAAWTTRPFVGNPESRGEFALVRPLEDTAFEATATLVESALFGVPVPSDDAPHGGCSWPCRR